MANDFLRTIGSLLAAALTNNTNRAGNAPRVVSLDGVSALAPQVRTGPPGALDSDFGRSGVVVTGLTGGKGNALAIHNDGSLVVAGVSSNDRGHPAITLARFDRDGKPLRSFGKTGCIRLDPEYPPVARSDCAAAAVAFQANGCILVAGFAQQPPSAFSFQDFVLARLTPDGILDPSFGSGGWMQLRLGMSSAANALSVERDGRILAAGYVRNPQSGRYQMLLMRVMPNGAPDPSFGNNGYAVLPGTAEVEEIIAIARPSQGNVIVGIAKQEIGFDKKFIAFRISSDGQLDPQFGNAGRRILDVGPGDNVIGGLAVQPDGKYVVAGYLNRREYFVLRLLPDGSLDPEFGDGRSITGRFGADAGGASDTSFGTAVAVSPEGTIYLGGSVAGGNGSDRACALMRFLPSGARDDSFGVNGTVLVDLGTGENWIRALALDGDAIMAAGDGANGLALLRFDTRARTDSNEPSPAAPPGRRAKGWLDATFGSGGAFFGDFNPAPASASAIVAQPDGGAVVVGSVGDPQDSAGRNVGLLRVGEHGAVDPGFGDRGYKVLDLEETDNIARAVTMQPDGKLIIAGEVLDRRRGAYEFALVRLDPNGRLDVSFKGGVVIYGPFPGMDCRAYAVTTQFDGKIVVAGNAYEPANNPEPGAPEVPPVFLDSEFFALARYEENGVLDKGFGVGGTVRTVMAPGPGSRVQARALQVLEDGRIVAAGFARTTVNDNFRFVAVARYLSDGLLDETFGHKGSVWQPMESNDEGAYALAVQPHDGKLVLAGESAVNADSAQHFMLVRLEPDGEPDTSFNGTGIVVNKEFTGVARSVAILPDGRIVAAGTAMVTGQTTNGEPVVREQVALVCYLPDGSIDESFGADGVLFVDLGGDSDGANGIALSGDQLLVAATRVRLRLCAYTPTRRNFGVSNGGRRWTRGGRASKARGRRAGLGGSQPVDARAERTPAVDQCALERGLAAESHRGAGCRAGLRRPADRCAQA